MKRIAVTGNTLTEYGLMIGLLALASVAGLKFMGSSTSDLLGGFSTTHPSVNKMMKIDFSSYARSGVWGDATGSEISLKGRGFYTQTVDPKTGKVEFKVTDSSNGISTNATSLEGDQWNILGQIRLADTLWQLAGQQTDEASQDFILSLAKASYYMGAAEGEIDGVNTFQMFDLEGMENNYGKINAYYDIRRLQGNIQALLSNPPANLDKQTLQQVSAMALDVYNIGQSYVTTLKPAVEYAEREGKLGFNLKLDISGVDQPGIALTMTRQDAVNCDKLSCGNPQSNGGPDIEEVFQNNIVLLREMSQKVLASSGTATAPVVATLTDATQIDHTATANQH
jgi:Flp pilus assembly pilin Flp